LEEGAKRPTKKGEKSPNVVSERTRREVWGGMSIREEICGGEGVFGESAGVVKKVCHSHYSRRVSPGWKKVSRTRAEGEPAGEKANNPSHMNPALKNGGGTENRKCWGGQEKGAVLTGTQ